MIENITPLVTIIILLIGLLGVVVPAWNKLAPRLWTFEVSESQSFNDFPRETVARLVAEQHPEELKPLKKGEAVIINGGKKAVHISRKGNVMCSKVVEKTADGVKLCRGSDCFNRKVT